MWCPDNILREGWLRDLEYATLDPMLKSLFGYHAVQLGGESALLQSCRMPDQWRVDPEWKTGVQLHAHYHELPFLTEHIDLLLLPHILEQVADPHAVLREATRALIPEGYLVILGLNPFSFYGIQFNMRRLLSDSLVLRLIPKWRIQEWLVLLGYELRAFHFYSRPLSVGMGTSPWGHWLWEQFKKMGYARLGYVVLAQKRVSHPLTWSRSKLKIPTLENARLVRPV